MTTLGLWAEAHLGGRPEMTHGFTALVFMVDYRPITETWIPAVAAQLGPRRAGTTEHDEHQQRSGCTPQCRTWRDQGTGASKTSRMQLVAMVTLWVTDAVTDGIQAARHQTLPHQ